MSVQTFYDVQQIKRDCESHTHFFDRGSMRFFDSRLGQFVIGTNNPYVWLFTTSEKFHDYYNDFHGRRLYTIRSYDSRTKSVNTVGEFQAYKTGREAKLAAMKLAREWEYTIDDQHEYALEMNKEYDYDLWRRCKNNYDSPLIRPMLKEVQEYYEEKELEQKKQNSYWEERGNLSEKELGLGQFYHD